MCFHVCRIESHTNAILGVLTAAGLILIGIDQGHCFELTATLVYKGHLVVSYTSNVLATGVHQVAKSEKERVFTWPRISVCNAGHKARPAIHRTGQSINRTSSWGYRPCWAGQFERGRKASFHQAIPAARTIIDGSARLNVVTTRRPSNQPTGRVAVDHRCGTCCARS